MGSIQEMHRRFSVMTALVVSWSHICRGPILICCTYATAEVVLEYLDCSFCYIYTLAVWLNALPCMVQEPSLARKDLMGLVAWLPVTLTLKVDFMPLLFNSWNTFSNAVMMAASIKSFIGNTGAHWLTWQVGHLLYPCTKYLLSVRKGSVTENAICCTDGWSVHRVC